MIARSNIATAVKVIEDLIDEMDEADIPWDVGLASIAAMAPKIAELFIADGQTYEGNL